ncbi:CLUMA_CG016620, isoform A [Clunio marinus]|uniref:CLUMA_CG016620, isoform A n=1 Tax=Clunio marinus TaxID=568069 RepID=A0A1J1IY88_9DIPT|nr:CLUMA_CG016620, isoform A [Clunio marinus]
MKTFPYSVPFALFSCKIYNLAYVFLLSFGMRRNVKVTVQILMKKKLKKFSDSSGQLALLLIDMTNEIL